MTTKEKAFLCKYHLGDKVTLVGGLEATVSEVVFSLGCTPEVTLRSVTPNAAFSTVKAFEESVPDLLEKRRKGRRVGLDTNPVAEVEKS